MATRVSACRFDYMPAVKLTNFAVILITEIYRKTTENYTEYNREMRRELQRTIRRTIPNTTEYHAEN